MGRKVFGGAGFGGGQAGAGEEGQRLLLAEQVVVEPAGKLLGGFRLRQRRQGLRAVEGDEVGGFCFGVNSAIHQVLQPQPNFGGGFEFGGVVEDLAVLVQVGEAADESVAAVLETEGKIGLARAGEQFGIELLGGGALGLLQDFAEQAGGQEAVGLQFGFGLGEVFAVAAGVELALFHFVGALDGVGLGGIGGAVSIGALPLQGAAQPIAHGVVPEI